MRTTTPKPPSWFKTLPNDAYLTSDEVAAILGYANTHTFRDALYHGNVPKPDRKVEKKIMNRFGHQEVNMWKVGTIRRHIKEKEERQHGKSQEVQP